VLTWTKKINDYIVKTVHFHKGKIHCINATFKHLIPFPHILLRQYPVSQNFMSFSLDPNVFKGAELVTTF
jgi:hypothetical protein